MTPTVPTERYDGVEMLMRRSAFFIVALLLSSPGLSAQIRGTFSGKVVGIADGKTISVMRNGKAERIRLDGIDCPDPRQDFSQRARQFTLSKVFNKTVTVQVRGIDQYGRLVSRVLIESEDLSVALVQQGLAWHSQYSDDPTLARAEADARTASREIWSQSSPTPPWEFRRGGAR